MPAVLSANKLIGESCGNGRDGTDDEDCGDEFANVDRPDVECAGVADGGGDWDGGGG